MSFSPIQRFLGLRPWVKKLTLALTSIVLILGLAEIALRVIESRTWRSGHLPNLRKVWVPEPGVMSGVSGRVRFSTNSLGIRGDEFCDHQRYHMLAIGGSTTECLLVDDEQAWPYRTQEILKQAGFPIWIGNVGISGARVPDHAKVMDQLVSGLELIDAAVLMVGINDLASALRFTLEERARRTPHAAGDSPAFYKKWELWKLYDRVERRLSGRDRDLVQDEAGAVYKVWRSNRIAASKVDSMPPLEEALTRYRSDLNELLDVAERRSVRVILMNQPTMWRSDLTAEEEALLWFGWGGDSQAWSGKYYATEVLARSMDMFNDVVEDVCRRRQVEFLDLAGALEKDTSSFYDDCHLNTSGSLKVAAILSQHLLRGDPIKLPR